MATYYVSQQRGNNSNDGLSAATPFLTLAKLQSVMTGVGDLAYIGPGTYRERYTVQANNQTITGDPRCLYVVGDTPGVCRITGADTNEIPSSGTIINCNARTGITIQGTSIHAMLQVGGSSDNYAITGTTGADTVVQFVGVSSNGGMTQVSATNCIAQAVQYAYNACNATSCIGIAQVYGYYVSGAISRAATNCLMIGGTRGYAGASTTNVTTVKNCIAFCTGSGYVGDSRGLTITTCSALYCGQGANGTNVSNALDVSTLFYQHCTAATAGTVTGSPTASGLVTFDPTLLALAFDPRVLAGVYGLGTAAGAPATDILGAAHKSPPDIGPYSNAASPRVKTNIPQLDRGRVANR